MAKVVLLSWPTSQASYGVKVKLSEEGQVRVAKEMTKTYLRDFAPPGEEITVAFPFGGFVPNHRE